ncbi:MAG: YjbH domain-containing protein [Bacteroidaceae bacterium]|nr:YjbH domain-containing protein [Bacteroidaceae bacterium]
MKKLLFILLLSIVSFSSVQAQFTYGTTGLLNMPTADMQKDKTFLFGGGFIEKHASTGRWFYDTFNYYVNITFFPWMEVAYTCTLHKAVPQESLWVPSTYGKFVNQDRNFHFRFRLWKEGWWKPWTPQIVVGANDGINNSWAEGSKFKPITSDANGFNNRYYVAITKHFDFNHVGELGAHASWVYNERKEYKLNGLCLGANFRFKLKDNGSFLHKAINGLNLMAEAYPADGQGVRNVAIHSGKNPKNFDRGVAIGKHDINIGACYSFWKDRINLYSEWYGCKDFSGGVQLKICLK